jgi:hypothetical protein
VKLIRFLVVLCALIGSAAPGEELRRWPQNADEFDTTIGVPPGFTAMRWRPTTVAKPGGEAPMLLSARFRSEDGKAEFAVLVYYVRNVAHEAEARRITLRAGRGEKVVQQKSARKKEKGEGGPYWIYDEETTVAGADYTRYRLNTFSTSGLPGAASVLWEFQVADEEARKRYAARWRQFKESLEIEGD